jgi:purine-binding chemotaxis protein CheW
MTDDVRLDRAEEQRLQTILDERAVALARDPEAAPERWVDVMLFRHGGEEYGVELAELRATQPARGVTSVPGTPAHIAGVLNVRGEIVSVLDLAAVLGLSGPRSETAHVLLADGPEGQVGLLVDEVLGVHEVPEASFSSTLTMTGFATSIGQTRFSMLRLADLFARASLVVDAEQAPIGLEEAP